MDEEEEEHGEDEVTVERGAGGEEEEEEVVEEEEAEVDDWGVQPEWFPAAVQGDVAILTADSKLNPMQLKAAEGRTARHHQEQLKVERNQIACVALVLIEPSEVRRV